MQLQAAHTKKLLEGEVEDQKGEDHKNGVESSLEGHDHDRESGDDAGEEVLRGGSNHMTIRLGAEFARPRC